MRHAAVYIKTVAAVRSAARGPVSRHSLMKILKNFCTTWGRRYTPSEERSYSRNTRQMLDERLPTYYYSYLYLMYLQPSR